MREPEPRWPALVAGFAVAIVYLALPEHLTLGPSWLLLALTFAFMAPTVIFHRMGNLRLNEIFAYTFLAIITFALVSSLVLLVMRLPVHKDQPIELLRSAAALWVANVLVFASWYWRLDGGGPNERDKRGFHEDGAFLFPQMTMDEELKIRMGEQNWSPGFIDYLFVAFNSSTAFSPTDVPVLSRWAKVMMMIQSAVSLTTIALLAARAVNIL